MKPASDQYDKHIKRTDHENQVKKSDRKKDLGRRLTPKEERQPHAIIVNKTSEQQKMTGFLWTSAKICDYINRMYRKTIVLQVISRYLKRWG